MTVQREQPRRRDRQKFEIEIHPIRRAAAGRAAERHMLDRAARR